MARKLIKREQSAQRLDSRAPWSHAAVIACQHGMLWSSLYVIASTAYLLAMGVISAEVLPSAVVLLVAVGTFVPPKVDVANLRLAGRYLHRLVGSAQPGVVASGSSIQRPTGEQITDSRVDGEKLVAFRRHSMDGCVWTDYHFHGGATADMSGISRSCTDWIVAGHWYTMLSAACRCRG